MTVNELTSDTAKANGYWENSSTMVSMNLLLLEEGFGLTKSIDRCCHGHVAVVTV